MRSWCNRVCGVLLLLTTSAQADRFDETSAVTLFAFDTVAIPHTQNLRLEMRTPTKHPGNPVLRRGPAGSVDAMGVQFYGSIIREADKYRLWYVAYDDDESNKVASSRWRAAYAESTDGLHWVKPDLGLVKHQGNTRNNLIQTNPAPWGFVNLKVLKDDDDPDPKRRYKIATHVYFRHNTRLGTLAPFGSADGLHWQLLIDAQPLHAELRKQDLVLPAVHFEPAGGLYRWDGMFYISGQNAMNAPRPYQGRIIRSYRSPDFVQWSPTSTIGFVRSVQHEHLGPGRSLEGEQCHEAISVWNRRNVLLGTYGRWHGAKEWKDITIDLGLVISNDGLQFREPAHEWTFLPRGADGEWDQGGLLQGQGFENIGEQTFVYYGAWDPRTRGTARGGVGIAVLPRDRFADLVVETVGKGPGDYQTPEITSEFVTAVYALPSSCSRLYVNVDGLGADAALKVELLDAQERPIPQYAGPNAAIVRANGFQTPVVWNGQPDITTPTDRIRLHVTFLGKRNTDIRLSALYLR